MREKGQTEVAKTLETPVFSRGIEILTEKLQFYKEKKHVLEWKEQAKMCMRFQKDIRQSLNLVLC